MTSAYHILRLENRQIEVKTSGVVVAVTLASQKAHLITLCLMPLKRRVLSLDKVIQRTSMDTIRRASQGLMQPGKMDEGVAQQ